MDNTNPLVSVFIVTYHSRDYVIDALESVKAQTYQNIELVVSDDCSKDGTVAIIKAWVDKNKDRFVRTEIVESPVNTGTSANYNRAVRACHGEWLKMMDGDDLLLPNCIEDNVTFVAESPKSQVVFSDMYLFRDENGRKIVRKKFKEKEKIFFEQSSTMQLKILLGENILPSQTCFIKASLLKTNPYDERYRLLEDYPMWINLSQKGFVFTFFDKCTAMYRLVDSVSSNREELYSSSYMVYSKQFNIDKVMPLIIKNHYSKEYDYNKKFNLLRDVCVKILNNRKNRFTVVLYYLFKGLIYYGLHFSLPSEKTNSI